MKLLRRENKKYTEGKLIYPDGSYTYCLERPWLNNKPYVSCIPYGNYIVLPDDTGRFRYFRVQNVKGRSHIEFHGATNVEDLEGCLAPCMELVNGQARYCREALNKLVSWHLDEKGNKTGFVLDIVKYDKSKDGEW